MGIEKCFVEWEWQEKCFGAVEMARKVFWHSRSDDLTPLKSDKIRAKTFDLGYGGARRALYNLSPKSVRFLSVAITIDW